MDNYICIDGVKVLLNDSQISELHTIFEKRETKKNSPFKRQDHGDKYYYIATIGKIDASFETNCDVDSVRHDNANYCTDKELLKHAHLKKFLRGGSGVTLWNMVGIRLIGVIVSKISSQFIVVVVMVCFILLLMQLLKPSTQPIL